MVGWWIMSRIVDIEDYREMFSNDSRIREVQMVEPNEVHDNDRGEGSSQDLDEDYKPSLTQLRDEACSTAVEHGFIDATPLEEIALMHTELSEAIEDFRKGMSLNDFVYLDKANDVTTVTYDPKLKPIGIPSEMADVIIRVLDFCGKHRIDIERAVLEKMAYNKTRPFKHGGKKI